MFKKKKPLPGAKGHLTIYHWNYFAGASESHTNVGRHIIGTFISMDKIRCILGNKVVKKSMKIGPCARVSILHNDEACAGVLHENRRRSSSNSRFGDDILYLASNLICSFSGGTD